jgi:alanine-alpha-ketoisovalerate/valine-pyruvate aminotransferase
MDENMAWYLSLSPTFAEKVSDDMGLAHLVMQRLANAAKSQGQDVLGAKLGARAAEVDTLYQQKLEDIATQGMRMSKARF